MEDPKDFIEAKVLTNYIFLNLQRDIKIFLKNLDTDNDPYYVFLRELQTKLQRKCRKCWGSLIKDYSFVSYVYKSRIWDEIFFFYPNKDNVFGTSFNKDNSSEWHVAYRSRNKFFSVCFQNTMMWDYDDKDSKISHIELYKMLNNIVDIGYKCGVYLTFMVFRSDRGWHIFETSNLWHRDSLYTQSFMMTVCNDNFYTAFTKIYGWSVRIGKKEDQPEDKVVEPADVTKTSDIKIANENLPIAVPLVTDLPTITFKGKYFKNIKLSYFTRQKLGQSIKKFLVGKVADINVFRGSDVLFHYLLVQCFRTISPENTEKIACGTYDHLLDLESDIPNIREDILSLRYLSNQKF